MRVCECICACGYAGEWVCLYVYVRYVYVCVRVGRDMGGRESVCVCAGVCVSFPHLILFAACSLTHSLSCTPDIKGKDGGKEHGNFHFTRIQVTTIA